MPRDGEKVRRRLQEAALLLYQERGYDRTTAAEIAEKAGVTGRTFFRHFADKREVLFGDETEFIAALTRALREAPEGMGPLEAMLHAFQSVEPILVAARAFTAPRQRVIAANPALQERAQSKRQAMISAVTTALTQRGLPDRLAALAAQVGMAALNYAVTAWFDGGSDDLNSQAMQAFRAVQALSSSLDLAHEEPTNLRR